MLRYLPSQRDDTTLAGGVSHRETEKIAVQGPQGRHNLVMPALRAYGCLSLPNRWFTPTAKDVPPHSWLKCATSKGVSEDARIYSSLFPRY